MFKQVDSELLRLHQWILDKTQLEPGKASKWMMHISIMLYMVHLVLRFQDGVEGSDWVVLCICPIAISVSVGTRLASLSGHSDQLRFYRIITVIAAAIPFEPTASALAYEFRLFAEVMMLYFAACQKPKPPNRKFKESFA